MVLLLMLVETEGVTVGMGNSLVTRILGVHLAGELNSEVTMVFPAFKIIAQSDFTGAGGNRRDGRLEEVVFWIRIDI